MCAQNMRRAIVALSAMGIECIHLGARGMVTGHVERVKIIPSVSICGPSATENPISAKIAVTSSQTWEMGWMVPAGLCRPGNVTSNHSDFKRSSKAASAMADLRALRAEFTSSFNALSAGPAICRSSGDILPNDRICRLISPFFPTA
jgi:hypothetical protein